MQAWKIQAPISENPPEKGLPALPFKIITVPELFRAVAGKAEKNFLFILDTMEKCAIVLLY